MPTAKPEVQMTIRLNKHMAGVGEPGDEIVVEARKGHPAERFWRNRLRDAETDECCEIVEASKPKRAARASTADEQSED